MVFYLILLCLSACFLSLRLIIRLASPAKNLPPGPTGLPIIGNLHQLGPMPHVSLSNMAQLYGPLISLRLGSITTVVASSPDLAKEILQKNDQSFANHTVPDAVGSQPHVEGTLAWVPGDHHWRNRRRVCSTQMFTAARLDSLEHLRLAKVRQLVAHIRGHCAAATPVDVGKVAFATTLNLISNTVFSTDIVDPEFKTAGEFKEVVWRIMEMAGKPNLSDYYPAMKWLDVQGVRKHVKPSYVRLHEIFDVLIEKRLQERANGADHAAGDFLDVLLDQIQENGSDFTTLTIKPLILDLFIAGSDTSGNTTEWAMAELLRNPEAMKKLRDELREVIGGDGEVKESDIKRLPYLQAVIKETLRLHPAAPLLLPYVAGNDTVIGGYTVPKGTQVMINAWLMGRSDKYWDEPMSFLPERFLESSVDYKGRDFEYLPFGAGRRICPGLPLAERMVALMLASIVHAFHWKLPEGTTPESLDMREQFGITLKKAVSLCAVPII